MSNYAVLSMSFCALKAQLLRSILSMSTLPSGPSIFVKRAQNSSKSLRDLATGASIQQVVLQILTLQAEANLAT